MRFSGIVRVRVSCHFHPPVRRLAHLPRGWHGRMFDVPSKPSRSPRLRAFADRAMMLLLASTGLRKQRTARSGARKISGGVPGSYSYAAQREHRDRLLPLLPETGAALAEYVPSRAAKDQRAKSVPIASGPRACVHIQWTVSRIVRVRLQHAGVPVKRGGAHLLRHSLATRLVTQGRPIKEVADCWVINTSIQPLSTSRSHFRSSPTSRCLFPGGEL